MGERLQAKIGYGVGTAVGSLGALRSEAAWAAQAGFDGLWVSQIFGVDPIVALSVIGSEHPELAELGTSVVPIYGRHPLALAAQAATAQAALEGRFTLGIGPSHEVVVEGLLGGSYARPFTYTREFLEALIPLLAGGTASVDGEEITAHGRLAIDGPDTDILLAALGPKMLDLAGRTCAGTSLGSCGPKTIRTHIVPRITEAARAAGRPEPRIMALVSIAVTDEPQVALDAARAMTKGYAELPAYRAMLDIEGVESPADLLIAGSFDDVLEGLQAYIDAGATDLRMGISTATPEIEASTRQAVPDLLR